MSSFLLGLVAALTALLGGGTAAESFVAFAEGRVTGAEVPWGEEVVYSIERDAVRMLDPRTAATREAWDSCPRGTATLEGRECPINVLDSVAIPAGEGDEVVVEGQPPPRILGCVRYRAPEVAGATTVWVRPEAGRRSCFTEMAVAVPVDAGGAIVAVDLALSGP